MTYSKNLGQIPHARKNSGAMEADILGDGGKHPHIIKCVKQPTALGVKILLQLKRIL